MNDRDSTYIRGQNCIEFLIVSAGLLECFDRSYIVDYNKVILTDYHGYITNITLEKYFNMNSFNVDCIDNSRLTSRKLSHKTKFT